MNKTIGGLRVFFGWDSLKKAEQLDDKGWKSFNVTISDKESGAVAAYKNRFFGNPLGGVTKPATGFRPNSEYDFYFLSAIPGAV